MRPIRAERAAHPARPLLLVTTGRGIAILRGVNHAEDAADLENRLARIKELTERLGAAQASADVRALAERIQRDVDAARAALKRLES